RREENSCRPRAIPLFLYTESRMSSVAPSRLVPANAPPAAPPEIEHLFQTSLFLLIVTGFGTLASTGKLDLFSVGFVSTVLILRAVLLLRDRPFLIPRRIAAWLAVV